MSPDPGSHHPRHIAEWLWLERLLKPVVVAQVEESAEPKQQKEPRPLSPTPLLPKPLLPIPPIDIPVPDLKPEETGKTPGQKIGIEEEGGEVVASDEQGVPSAAQRHSISALPELENALGYSRALHRVIPLRPVPGSQEIDVQATVQRSAAGGGLIDPVVVEKQERRGHLIIIEPESLSFEPWRRSVDRLDELARTVGSFRDVQRIKIPQDFSEESDEDFNKLRQALRPGRPTLVLLVHDGIDEAIEDGRIGQYLDRQVRSVDRQAKIAWLHPWPETQWSHTAVEGLFRRGISGHIEGELILPVLPLGLKTTGRFPGDSDNPRPGLAHLEGWLDGQGVKDVAAYGVPSEVDSEVLDHLDDLEDDPTAEEKDWDYLYDRFVSSTTEAAARMLGAAAAASGLCSLSVPFLEVLCSVSEKSASQSAEQSRHAVAAAITSGFFERVSVTRITSEEDALTHVRLRVCPEGFDTIFNRLTPSTIGRVVGDLTSRSFQENTGADLQSEIHWNLLRELADSDDLPEGLEKGPDIDLEIFVKVARALGKSETQIDTMIETYITPGTKKKPGDAVDGLDGEVGDTDAAEEDLFENWDAEKLEEYLWNLVSPYANSGGVTDPFDSNLEHCVDEYYLHESAYGYGALFDHVNRCTTAFLKLHLNAVKGKAWERYRQLLLSQDVQSGILEALREIEELSADDVLLDLPRFGGFSAFQKHYAHPDPQQNLLDLQKDLREEIFPAIFEERFHLSGQSDDSGGSQWRQEWYPKFKMFCAFLDFDALNDRIAREPEAIKELEPLLYMVSVTLVEWRRALGCQSDLAGVQELLARSWSKISTDSLIGSLYGLSTEDDNRFYSDFIEEESVEVLPFAKQFDEFLEQHAGVISDEIAKRLQGSASELTRFHRKPLFNTYPELLAWSDPRAVMPGGEKREKTGDSLPMWTPARFLREVACIVEQSMPLFDLNPHNQSPRGSKIPLCPPMAVQSVLRNRLTYAEMEPAEKGAVGEGWFDQVLQLAMSKLRGGKATWDLMALFAPEHPEKESASKGHSLSGLGLSRINSPMFGLMYSGPFPDIRDLETYFETNLIAKHHGQEELISDRQYLSTLVGLFDQFAEETGLYSDTDGTEGQRSVWVIDGNALLREKYGAKYFDEKQNRDDEDNILSGEMLQKINRDVLVSELASKMRKDEHIQFVWDSTVFIHQVAAEVRKHPDEMAEIPQEIISESRSWDEVHIVFDGKLPNKIAAMVHEHTVQVTSCSEFLKSMGEREPIKNTRIFDIETWSGMGTLDQLCQEWSIDPLPTNDETTGTVPPPQSSSGRLRAILVAAGYRFVLSTQNPKSPTLDEKVLWTLARLGHALWGQRDLSIMINGQNYSVSDVLEGLPWPGEQPFTRVLYRSLAHGGIEDTGIWFDEELFSLAERAGELGSVDALKAISSSGYHDRCRDQEYFAVPDRARPASIALGEVYLAGRGVEQDVPRGVQILHDAYIKDPWLLGSPPGKYELLDLLSRAAKYIDGEGVEKNPVAGTELLKIALEIGEKESSYSPWPDGFPDDVFDDLPFYTLRLLKCAVDSNESPGVEVRGRRLLFEAGSAGKAGEDDSSSAAKRWLQRAADSGDVEAMMELGRQLTLKSSDDFEGYAWMHRAAEQGGTEYLAEFLHHYGDVDEAIHALRPAAEEGELYAMRSLGEQLWIDNQFESDAENSEWLSWLEKAANAGDGWSMSHLSMHAETEEARLHWLRKSAESPGVFCNKFDLAKLYLGRSEKFKFLGEDIKYGIELDVDIVEGERLLAELAEEGNAEAMFYLSSLMFDGVIDPQDSDVAEDLLRRAADSREPDAQVDLVKRLLHGKGVTQDVEEAKRLARNVNVSVHPQLKLGLLFLEGDVLVDQDLDLGCWLIRQSAESGYASAMTGLGTRLLEGDGFEKDLEEGRSWLRKAAEAGDRVAMGRLGNDLFLAPDLERDVEEGERWLRKAAKAGNTEAKGRLGSRLLYRSLGSSDTSEEGERWLRDAAEAGDPRAMGKLSHHLLRGYGLQMDLAESCSWLRKAAEAEDPVSMRNLSTYLEIGNHGFVKDVEEGRTWLRKAAEAKDPQAMGWLGNALLEGNGFEKDVEEGRSWIRKAAEAKNDHFMHRLGLRLLEGDGFEKDLEEGRSWLRKAAEAENLDAMLNLGTRLLDGDGFEKDREEGLGWLNEARGERNLIEGHDIQEPDPEQQIADWDEGHEIPPEDDHEPPELEESVETSSGVHTTEERTEETTNPFKALDSKYRTLEEALGSLVTIAREAEQGEIAERVEVTLAKAKERVFRVAIAGEFSTGKSTVINALLGEELLPTALEACTAVVTRIRRAEEGEEPGILVTFRKSGQRRIEKEKLREVLTFEGQEKKDLPTEAQVILPSGTFLDHGIEIIDTPGVNDPEARGEQITLGFLPQADAIIFITHAARAFKESEIEFLRDRVGNQDRQRVLFVVNACDILEEEEDRDDLRERGESLLEKIYGKPTVHLASARDGLQARISGDDAQWKLSGMAAFKNDLDRLLTRDRGAAELERNQELAFQFRSELQRRIQDMIEDLGLDDEIRERRAVHVEEGIALLEFEEKKILKSIEENFRSVRNSVDGVLSGQMDVLTWELMELQSRGKEEQQQLEERISDRAQQAVQSCGKRTLTQIQSTLRTQMDRVHGELASQMTRSIREAKRVIDGTTFDTPNYGNLVSVHTNLEVEEERREIAPEGMSLAGSIGLALLGPWGALGGAIYAVTIWPLLKWVERHHGPPEGPGNEVSVLRKRISESVEPAVTDLEERTRSDARGVFSAKIAEFRERLADLQELRSRVAERDQQRARAGELLKKLRKIPLPGPLADLPTISEKTASALSGTDPTPVSPAEGGTRLKPEIANHPFWGDFFRRGVPMHPELEGLTPTGNMKKIGPSIGNRVQIDIDWTGNGVRLRPLSTKPENLRRLLVDREAFEKEVGVPEEWKEGTEKFLSITLLPAPKAIQATWSTERQVTETLELYGRIKKYLQARM